MDTSLVDTSNASSSRPHPRKRRKQQRLCVQLLDESGLETSGAAGDGGYVLKAKASAPLLRLNLHKALRRRDATDRGRVIDDVQAWFEEDPAAFRRALLPLRSAAAAAAAAATVVPAAAPAAAPTAPTPPRAARSS